VVYDYTPPSDVGARIGLATFARNVGLNQGLTDIKELLIQNIGTTTPPDYSGFEYFVGVPDARQVAGGIDTALAEILANHDPATPDAIILLVSGAPTGHRIADVGACSGYPVPSAQCAAISASKASEDALNTNGIVIYVLGNLSGVGDIPDPDAPGTDISAIDYYKNHIASKPSNYFDISQSGGLVGSLRTLGSCEDFQRF